jgi:hypothetical protein
VERSTDAVAFSFIGKVTAAGSSTSPLTYRFIDNVPAKGLNYYRLKQVDRDGRFVYTPVRVLQFDELDAGLVKYYPNPTSSILNIELTETMRVETKVLTLSNSSGLVVAQVKYPTNSNLIIPIDMSRYARGIYFINVKTTTANSTQRIVLQ